MIGTKLQSLVGKGYARSAAKIGTAHSWYRGGLVSPIAPANLLGSLPATFAPDKAFQTIPKYNSLLFYAFVDTTQVQPGDILVGVSTWVLVASGLIPPAALLCPQTVTIQRAAQAFSPSTGATQGVTTIAQDFPCNIQLKRDKGFSMPVGFPAQTNTSAPMPEWQIYVPRLTDGEINGGDILTDQLGNTYKTDAVQFTPYGYMLAATPYVPEA